MRQCLGKLRKILLLSAFVLLLTPAGAHAAGRSPAAVKKLLTKYQSWLKHADDTDKRVRMDCPEYDLSEKEILDYLVDITGLLKGAAGEDACYICVYFYYHGKEYGNDFDTFSEHYDMLQDTLGYAWPYWCGMDALRVHHMGLGDTEFVNEILLDLNGAEAGEAYREKLKQIVADGRAAAGSEPRALAEYFRSWILDNIEYDLERFYYDSEGAVLYGSTICQGFACAFYDLCTVAGIPVLAPASDDLDHMWNEVYFDGQWYTLDMLDVVTSVDSGQPFFTDPDGLCSDPDMLHEMERQLASPVPFPLTKSTVALDNKTVNIRDYLCGLSPDVQILCTSSDPDAIRAEESGKIVPAGGGTAEISITVQQNGTAYPLKMNFRAPKPVPKKGKVLTEEKTKASYVVTKAGSAVAYKGPANKGAASVTIPATVKIGGITYKVTSISDKAFSGSKALRKVTIGTNVEKIGASAFQNCTALKKITIPAKVTSIGKKAFYNCRNVTSIVIRTKKLKAKTVGSSAFTGAGSADYGKLTVETPKKSQKTYASLLVKRGLSKKAKIRQGAS